LRVFSLFFEGISFSQPFRLGRWMVWNPGNAWLEGESAGPISAAPKRCLEAPVGS